MARQPIKCPEYRAQVLGVMDDIARLCDKIGSLQADDQQALMRALERVHAHAVIDPDYQAPLGRFWTLSECDLCDGIRRMLPSVDYRTEEELAKVFS